MRPRESSSDLSELADVVAKTLRRSFRRRPQSTSRPQPLPLRPHLYHHGLHSAARSGMKEETWS